jgi:hypothetical protein
VSPASFFDLGQHGILIWSVAGDPPVVALTGLEARAWRKPFHAGAAGVARQVGLARSGARGSSNPGNGGVL